MASIPDYVRPQLTIEQNLAIVDSTTLERLYAVVIGPQYRVSRFDADAPENPTAFASAGVSVPYAGLAAGEAVDASFTRLYGVGLEALLADLTANTKRFRLYSLDEPNVVWFQNDGASVAVAGTGRDDAIFRGRDLAVGDVLRFNGGYNRTVVGLRGVSVAAVVGAPAEGPYNPVAKVGNTLTASPAHPNFTPSVTGTFAGLAKGATYQGKYGDFFTIRVTTAGAPGTAVLSIRSATGLYDADNVPTTNSAGDYVVDPSYFDGLTLTIDATRDLTTADVLSFRIEVPYARALSTAGVVAIAGTYTGAVDTQYVLRVTKGGAIGTAEVQVTDTAGVEPTLQHVTADGVAKALGSYGLTFTFDATPSGGAFPNGGLRKGDVYVISATAAKESSTAFDKVILDGPAVEIAGLSDTTALLSAYHTLPFTDEIDRRAVSDTVPAFVAGSNAVAVRAALSLYVGARSAGYKWVPFIDAVGALHLTYRALVPPVAGETHIRCANVSEAILNFGSITDIDNVLGYGVRCALLGAQGRPVFVRRTAGVAVDDFAAALAPLENSDLFYSFTPLSENADVIALVTSHVEAMSQPEVKNFRRAYVGTSSPGAYSLLGRKASGAAFVATINSFGGVNVRVRCEDATFLSLGLVAGDTLRTNYALNDWGDETFDEYKISRVLNDKELILVTGPAAPVAPAQRFEIWKPDTAAATVAYVAARSQAIGSRRVVNVWVDRPTATVDGVTTVIPAMFVAAEIAGLRSSLLPQQGLTHTEITTITSASGMYTRFSQTQLDTVAAAGTMVVTQDIETSAIYIRHQLTTKVDSGSLYYEDSVGVNLDNISFLIKDALSGFIGNRNANAQTLGVMQTRVSRILDDQVEVVSVSDVGPALIGYTDLVVELDPVARDTANISAELEMPLPLNRVKVRLNGSVNIG